MAVSPPPLASAAADPSSFLFVFLLLPRLLRALLEVPRTERKVTTLPSFLGAAFRRAITSPYFHVSTSCPSTATTTSDTAMSPLVLAWDGASALSTKRTTRHPISDPTLRSPPGLLLTTIGSSFIPKGPGLKRTVYWLCPEEER